MSLERTVDYELAETATQMDARNPFEKITVAVLFTKDYAFTIPQKSKAGAAMVQIASDYDIFSGKSVPEGVAELASKSENVEAFENELKTLLSDNKKWIYELGTLKRVKFTSLFGKQGCSLMRPTKVEVINLSFKKKAEGKTLRAFHEKNK